MDRRWLVVALSFGVAVLLAFANGCNIVPQECFRAVRCVKACGDTPVKEGCEACDEGTFDDLGCGQDAGQADAGN